MPSLCVFGGSADCILCQECAPVQNIRCFNVETGSESQDFDFLPRPVKHGSLMLSLTILINVAVLTFPVLDHCADTHTHTDVYACMSV